MSRSQHPSPANLRRWSDRNRRRLSRQKRRATNETATRSARTRQHGMGAFRQCRRDAPERAEGRLREARDKAEETPGKEAGIYLTRWRRRLPTWSGKQSFRYEFKRSTLDVRIFCGDNCFAHLI